MGVSRIVLGRGAGVKPDCGNSEVRSDPGSVKIGEVIIVDTHSHLDGHGDVAGRSDGLFQNLLEQSRLPRQGRPTTLPRHLGHRATEVHVDVIGVVFVDEDSGRCTHRLRIDAVQLD
ncbi:unannotated protein [freshwater metagenome]|uniref:Unannotated protein n=1 Tax=freshwater metagenome TaxID=449393 RepID=A0A6J6B9S2_9ZZZZ